ncbi:MAG TPA: AMP-binding protein [Terriglobales bacterium]|nr:AMP-binding protein [Terriglobales bacterium]
MNFLETIFGSLERAQERVVLREIRGGEFVSVTGRELLGMIGEARSSLARRGMRRGDRCALLGHNSIRWVALDLAIMAEGLIVVPLYARQAPGELVVRMKDCSPVLICCGDAELREAIAVNWAEAPPQLVFDEIFASRADVQGGMQRSDSEAVTIIYTSGTSGEAKGVVLTAGNIGHMLGCTSGRLDVLNEVARGENQKALTTKDTKGHEGKTSLLSNEGTKGGERRPDRVFHYLPFCFAGSWIMLLTCLQRGSLLTLSTDLSTLAADLRRAEPDYFLNVPALLERMRKAVDEQLWKTGGVIQHIYARAKVAWGTSGVRLPAPGDRLEAEGDRTGHVGLGDRFYLWAAKMMVFPTIRKKMIGENLKALICGSAPLNVETQLYFMMLGIPVLQVYGLTETTAICTMDDPRRVEPGWVGPAIEGVEMRLGENDEIVVRGANIFRGYWNRAEETAKVLRDGWFHTGDQGEVNAAGNWRIVGRIKNLIILGSGHNVAPEPIEEKILHELVDAQQAVLVGNGRGYLCAIITGPVTREQAQRAVDAVNAELPHYKQVRGFHVREEPFSIENRMLTANGKLKRDVIYQQMQTEIEELYAQKQAS